MVAVAGKRFVYGHLELCPFWNRDLFLRLKQTTECPFLRTMCGVGFRLGILVSIRIPSHVRRRSVITSREREDSSRKSAHPFRRAPCSLRCEVWWPQITGRFLAVTNGLSTGVSCVDLAFGTGGNGERLLVAKLFEGSRPPLGPTTHYMRRYGS